MVSVEERLGHSHNNISRLMGLLVHSSHLEFQFLRVFDLTYLCVRLENPLNLVLQDVSLHDDDSLGLEYFIRQNSPPAK